MSTGHENNTLDMLPDKLDTLPDKLDTLPVHIQPLHHQVAGHVYDKKKAKLGFLGCGDGTILKPLQSGGRGESELKLYRSVFNPACTSLTLLQLRQLVPNFLGTYTLPEHPHETYLRLQDMTARMVRPCVADIKLGRRTYDPLAGPEKITREEAKYPPAKKLGFQFRGMRVYDAASDSFTTFGKEYLRSFDENTVEQAFIKFFTNGGSLRKDAVKACLDELHPVRTWFTHQTQLSFYASSLLVVYEGNPKLSKDSQLPTSSTQSSSQCNGVSAVNVPIQLESGAANNHNLAEISQNDSQLSTESSSQCNGTATKEEDCQSQSEGVYDHNAAATNGAMIPEDYKTHVPCRAVIRLIDFAHVFPVDHVDENNLHGVETVIDLFEKLLNK